MKIDNNIKLFLTNSDKGLSVCLYPTDYSINGYTNQTEFKITGQLVLDCLSEEKRHVLMKLLGLAK